MSARYERVNAHDDDEPVTPVGRQAPQPIPNSPPPSFHSRASSMTNRERAGGPVNPDLADAFDSADDDSDDDADDRQRLVRRNTPPSTTAAPSSSSTAPAAAPSTTAQRAPAAATAARAGGAAAGGRIYGGGMGTDGVFSNMAAKPEQGVAEKDEMPPTYEQAAADQAPPYWETTILAPGFGGLDEVYIDGMPVGSLFSFMWNGLISMSFQLVGFLLTYLLHSTHAAKNGSRAGLGITLIQYGFYMKTSDNDGVSGAGGTTVAIHPGEDGFVNPPDPNAHNFDPNVVNQGADGGDGGAGGVGDISGSEWIAYILMVVGWFILIRAVSDYLRARHHEQLVLQSPDRGLGVPVIAAGERSETVV